MAPTKVMMAVLCASGVALALAGSAPSEAQTRLAPPIVQTASAHRATPAKHHRKRIGAKPARAAKRAARTRLGLRPKQSVRWDVQHTPWSGVHRAKWEKPPPPASGLLVLAGCYGRFIAWRDELAALMLQANSYTPWPDDRARFDGMEQAFAAGARRDRDLVLTLRPSFREADFPPDVRVAFRSGLAAATIAFADDRYRHTQLLVLGQPDLSPRQRMAQLEANTDEAFAPLAAPCERLIAR